MIINIDDLNYISRCYHYRPYKDKYIRRRMMKSGRVKYILYIARQQLIHSRILELEPFLDPEYAFYYSFDGGGCSAELEEIIRRDSDEKRRYEIKTGYKI